MFINLLHIHFLDKIFRKFNYALLEISKFLITINFLQLKV